MGPQVLLGTAGRTDEGEGGGTVLCREEGGGDDMGRGVVPQARPLPSASLVPTPG